MLVREAGESQCGQRSEENKRRVEKDEARLSGQSIV